MIINKDFFSQETSEVSKLLLGKVLHFNKKRGVIVETEAYKDHTDLASHACRSKTKRNAPMFGPAGMTYVYLIYGIHHCFNITADQKPGAVLIRSVIDIDTKILVNGPGKVCKHYDINKKHNNIDVVKNNYIESINLQINFIATKRIGISKAQDKLWRYLCINQESILKLI